MAKALGKSEDFEYFTNRSLAYRNVYDKNTGFMRGRDSAGIFAEPFDPTFASYGKSDFIEGNSWQYSLFVPHDIPGLIEIMGGKDSLAKKLDELFSVETSSLEGKPIDVSGLIGEYAHGNEPSHHVAYLYNYTDKQWRGQERLHEIMSELYTNTPEGLCGNEDMGQMSAWYVFSALGFYPLNPADGNYVFGTPIIQSAEISLPNQKKFIIEVENQSTENIYIQAIEFNGNPITENFFKHSQMPDGKLVFKMAYKRYFWNKLSEQTR